MIDEEERGNAEEGGIVGYLKRKRKGMSDGHVESPPAICSIIPNYKFILFSNNTLSTYVILNS